MGALILLRHGKTLWNLEGRFTGQTDIPLSPQGEEEARTAGQKLKDFTIVIAHTSMLTRSVRTAELALETSGQKSYSLRSHAALNERHYGVLQGRTHAEVIVEHGEDQVKLWRRSFDVRPPEGESLADTAQRVHQHFEQKILLDFVRNQDILVVAHHNSLRALVMKIEGISSAEINRLEIPTGVPWVYEYKNNVVSPIRNVL